MCTRCVMTGSQRVHAPAGNKRRPRTVAVQLAAAEGMQRRFSSLSSVLAQPGFESWTDQAQPLFRVAPPASISASKPQRNGLPALVIVACFVAPEQMPEKRCPGQERVLPNASSGRSSLGRLRDQNCHHALEVI